MTNSETSNYKASASVPFLVLPGVPRGSRETWRKKRGGGNGHSEGLREAEMMQAGEVVKAGGHQCVVFSFCDLLPQLQGSKQSAHGQTRVRHKMLGRCWATSCRSELELTVGFYLRRKRVKHRAHPVRPHMRTGRRCQSYQRMRPTFNKLSCTPNRND